MIDLRKSKNETEIELDLADQIKGKLVEGISVQSVITALIKIGLICLSPIFIKVYEIKIKNRLTGDLNQLNSEFQVKQQEIKKIDQKLAVYKGSKDQRAQFENKFEILTKLAQERLQIVEILDNLQLSVQSANLDEKGAESVKEFMFFDSVRVRGDSVDIDAKASNEEVIRKFVFSLQNDSIYSRVDLGRVSHDQSNFIKKFVVKGIINKESN